MQALELAKTEDGRNIEDSWEKLCEISRRELDDETKVSDDDILGLPLNVAFMKQFKRGDTVKTVLEKAVQEARNTHLPPLQKEIGQCSLLGAGEGWHEEDYLEASHCLNGWLGKRNCVYGDCI